jgi:indole-3-glycerol phosphate synthase
VQVTNRWNPPGGPLGRLSVAAAARAYAIGRELPSLRDRARDLPPPPSFADALRAGDTVAVIAEIKRRSPSKGTINADLRAADRAALYAGSGARALSVLTEPSEFGGHIDDLVEVSARVHVPLLRKDFHVADVQVWEARAAGASAILFIARALAPDRLPALVDEAQRAGLEVLVEVRSGWELERALATGAGMVGVNARDLETLAIEPEVTARLIPLIPVDRVRVAESGMTSVDDVARAAALGADAVLIGSALSAAPDPRALLAGLAGVARGAGGG